MAREPKTGKKPIEQYDHKDKKRVNNPPVGLVTPELDQEEGFKKRSVVAGERIFQTPEKTRKARLAKIEKALQLAVPQLRQLNVTKDDRGAPHLEAIYEHWRPRAGKQREEEFSDGTLRLTGFLWSLLEGDSLLLLEEPELSLHAAIIRRLPGLIWRIQSHKKRQVLISTHSFDLLMDKGVGADEVLLLIPDVEKGFSLAEAAIPLTLNGF